MATLDAALNMSGANTVTAPLTILFRVTSPSNYIYLELRSTANEASRAV